MECGEFLLRVKFEVRLFSSEEIRSPVIVTARAVIFNCHGMVMIWVFMGGMLCEIMNPAKILPSARRLMGFMSLGLFSLIVIRGGYRGFVIVTK